MEYRIVRVPPTDELLSGGEPEIVADWTECPPVDNGRPRTHDEVDWYARKHTPQELLKHGSQLHYDIR